MKIYVVLDSTDSWSGEINVYAAFKTLEAARDYLANVKKVPLDLYDRRGEEFTEEEEDSGIYDGYWNVRGYLNYHHSYLIEEVELND